MKRYLFILLLALSFSGYAQPKVNNYKYIIVPEKFNFLKEVNQYNLNTLTKAIFEEKGFTVYYDNAELPTEIAADKCKALTVDVQEKNTLFVTSLTILLKDCKGNILLKSKEGKNREKEYKTAYNFALRDAFTSLNDLLYVAGSTTEAPATATAAAAVPATPTSNTKTESPAVSQPIATAEAKPVEGLLYAQPIANGFQLIDASPKIVITLLKISVPDYFIASNGTANGIVLKKDGNWFFEYYKNNALVAEKLTIKF
ncbi:hypothetical protein [Pedobacter rhizosphaerae]|uniref:Beta-lactamase-inhibitor-like, PepSY-like n=1 Tax=Pedobacter rhizosphaerae TaxID=390241 RepID=A0A1H9U072_9SPHI|nr:hypothetical protein [Pedobacter rhizosphaerae]SES03050.1 hypothetical protein SAMN04488023_12629 [Pedobacter rhizosphaerae]